MLSDAFKRADEKEEFGVVIEKSAAQFRPFDLLNEADKRLATHRVVPPPDINTKYRASGISKMCPVQEILRHRNKVSLQDNVDAKLRKTFDFGNGFHFIVQNEWFGKLGWLVGDWICTKCGHIHKRQLIPAQCGKCCGKECFHYVELELDGATFTGHPDGILNIEGVDYVMELKTCNSKNYEYIVNFSKKPLPSHKDQISIYMDLLGIPRGFIIYFDKDNSEWFSFYQTLDVNIVSALKRKDSLVKHGIKNPHSPLPLEARVCSGKSCEKARKCPVRNLCYQ